MRRRFILLGPPASGKGTQAALIQQKYGIPTLSTGALLRDELKAGDGSLNKWVSQGGLVPDEIVFQLVVKWLDQHKDAFVFDGFPRTITQAELLDAELNQRHCPIDTVIQMEISSESIQNRILARLTCAQCGAIYSNPSSSEVTNDQCARCGGKLERRVDDSEEVMRKRLEEYRAKTQPLSDYYRRDGRLTILDASEDRAAIFEKISQIIEGKAS